MYSMCVCVCDVFRCMLHLHDAAPKGSFCNLSHLAVLIILYLSLSVFFLFPGQTLHSATQAAPTASVHVLL